MKPENYPNSPEHLWNIFYDFTQTPRPSKKEEKIRNYLINIANEKNLEHQVDSAGNILIKVPASSGRESSAPLLIQNHIDMVTDSLPERNIDFEKDPIELQVKNGWVKAVGTTLGADNGIGCAAALATLFDSELIHPPLELLFTVDEETGLHGALGLDTSMLSARRMLNLDTEEWGSLYIGCAGGIDYELTRDIDLKEAHESSTFYEISIKGFLGGHSGLDIHEQRGNAIKLLTEYLILISQERDIEIAEIRAGKAHNIIPRDAKALIALNESNSDALKILAEELMAQWRSFLPSNDQDFSLSIEQTDQKSLVINQETSAKIIDLLLMFPHGAHAFDLNAKDIVSMSNNLARLLIVRGKFYIQTSLRFFDREEVKSLEKEIHALGRVFELKVVTNSEYPSWKPSVENSMLELVKTCYNNLYGTQPIVTAIHAGLECGILRDKIGPLDVVSFGPTINGAHSPEERVEIESVSKFWELFKAVLAAS